MAALTEIMDNLQDNISRVDFLITHSTLSEDIRNFPKTQGLDTGDKEILDTLTILRCSLSPEKTIPWKKFSRNWTSRLNLANFKTRAITLYTSCRCFFSFEKKNFLHALVNRIDLNLINVWVKGVVEPKPNQLQRPITTQ